MAIVQTREAEYRVFDVQGEACGLVLFDPGSGEIGFRFREDWASVAPEEADVLAAIAEDLPQKAHEMGAREFLSWIDETLSNIFRVELPRATALFRFDLTLDTLFRRHVAGNVRDTRRVLLMPWGVAASPFGAESGGVDAETVALLPHERSGPDWFAARIRGRSMEPDIPDGSLCLFRPYTGGSRVGQIVLIEKAGPLAGEGTWALKRYERSGAREEGEEFRGGIRAVSKNPEFDAFELDAAESYRVLGIFDRILELPLS